MPEIELSTTVMRYVAVTVWPALRYWARALSMAKAQVTVFTTGAVVVLAGDGLLTPPPEMVKAEAMLRSAASSSADTVAPDDAVADTKERVTLD